jgi:hypothetical protein
MHVDHFVVLGEGKLADIAPTAPVAEGAEIQIELVEVDRHDASAAAGKVDGFEICVGEAAELVGKKVKVRVERVLDGIGYATLIRRAGRQVPEPLTAEAEAEKPTRKVPARKAAEAGSDEAGAEVVVETVESDGLELGDVVEIVIDLEEVDADEPEADEDEDEDVAEADGEADVVAGDGTVAPAKKKTRRGSRGGRNRKKKPAGAAGAADVEADADATEPSADGDEPADAPEPAAKPAPRAPRARTVTIHVPGDELGRDPDDESDDEVSANGGEPGLDGAAPKKKRTRRGSRGGRKRTKPAGAIANGVEADEAGDAVDETELEIEVEVVADVEAPAEPEPDEAETNGDAPEAEAQEWVYVPMSEWGDDLRR